MVFYTNGGIYRCNLPDNQEGLALAFTSFMDDETLMVMPLSDRSGLLSIPLLVDSKLTYASICGLFRIRKEDLHLAVAILDSDGIDLVARNVAAALRGTFANFIIPEAIMMKSNLRVPIALSKTNVVSPAPGEVNIVPSLTNGTRQRYTLEDYDYIIKNYLVNTDDVLAKYSLKDKQALYRLKYALQKRFGKMPGTATGELTDPTGSVELGEPVNLIASSGDTLGEQRTGEGK